MPLLAGPFWGLTGSGRADSRNPLDEVNQKDYTEYESYRSVLGELAPATFEEFQNAKETPDVTIKVVSNKQIEGNVWGYRR